MLARAYRLRTRADYNKAYSRGTVIHGSYVVVRKRNNRSSSNRFGIVISKKISKSAVVRNKYKRRISEIIRTNPPNLSSSDLVIIAKPAIKQASTDQLKQDIIQVLDNHAKPRRHTH